MPNYSGVGGLQVDQPIIGYDGNDGSLVTATTDPANGAITGLVSSGRDVLADCGIRKLSNSGGVVMVDWGAATIGSVTAGWTVTKSTEKAYAGKTALRVTATAGAADTLTCDITIPPAFFGGAKRICFGIAPSDAYIAGDGDNPIQLWLNYSGSTTHRVLMFVGLNHIPGQWHDSGALFDQAVSGSGHISGTAQWAKVGSEEVTVIRLVLTKRAGQAISVPTYVGPIYTDPIREAKSTLTIFMDGNYSGQWKYARQLLQAYGLRASLSVVFPWINAVGSMTEAQIMAMYALGHELICHTGTPGDVGWDNTTKYPDGKEYALVRADIEAAWEWMRVRGATRGIGYGVVGFSNGLVNTQTLDRRMNIGRAVVDAGMVKCRQLSSFYGSYYGNGREVVNMVTPSQMVTSASSTATLTGLVDGIIAQGGWSGLTFHDFVISGATGNNYNVADFETVLDYIGEKVKAGLLRVLPFGEAMRAIDAVSEPK
jgi:hypothetical protein